MRLTGASIFFFLCWTFATTSIAQTVDRVGPESVGFTTRIPQVTLFDNPVQNQSNWEPYTGAFSDGTLAAVTNTEIEGDTVGVTERGMAVWFNPDNSVQEVPGFLDDSGNPWTVTNDTIRTDGNMPRIAPEVRDGQTTMTYMFGNECTPWAYPALFPSYGSGFTYDSITASVQILSKSETGVPVAVTNVFEPTYGQETTGSQGGYQIRFGGSIRMLANGNFIVVQEDRTGILHPDNEYRCPAASIWDQSGNNIVPPWCAITTPTAPTDPWPRIGIWDSLDCFDSGFAIRNEDNRLTFWNNDGSWMGRWTANSRQASEPWSWPLPGSRNTSITSWSPQSERVSSHIELDYVHLVGRGFDSEGNTFGGVFVTRVRKDQTTIGEAYVSQGHVVAPQRCESCTDRNGNVFVVWSDSSNTGALQVVGRLYDSDLDPLSEPFLVFENSEVGPWATVGFSAKHPSCHMVSEDGGNRVRILVTARVDAPAVALGLKTNDNIATVFTAPLVFPTSTPTQTPIPTATNTLLPTPTRTPRPTETATWTPLPQPTEWSASVENWSLYDK